jgi:SAM-dependent methyltransferase
MLPMLDVLHYHAWRRFRAAYYQFDLARIPFGQRLGRAVTEWEKAQGFGDSPKDKSRWDEEYSDGRWAYIGQLNENSRYWTLIGYMDAFRGNGEFLEVGCGEGLLYRHFRSLGYERYTGFDISDIAIEKLIDQNDARTNFYQADGDDHEPLGQFDVIIFNESLYYLSDPVSSIERYSRMLKPDGCMLISTYMDSRRSLATLRNVKRNFKLLDETRITNGPASWLCTILKRR